MKLKEVSIRRKLTFAIMTTTTVVLLLTGVIFGLYEWIAFRNHLRLHLDAIGSVIAYNTPELISFQLRDEATNNLALVAGERNIVAAALYTTGGELFAAWPRDMPPDMFPEAPQNIEPRFSGGYLVLSRPVTHQGMQNGTLYLKSDVRELYSRFWLYTAIIAVVLLGSALIALFLSSILQKSVANPILALAEIARAVSQRRDYSVRARKLSSDEVGVLTDAFNHMLTQIQDRESALRQSEERFRQLADAIPAFVWTADVEGKLIYINERWYEYTGFTPEQSMGTGWLNAKHPEDRAHCEHIWNDSLKHGTPYEVEARFRRTNGDYRWFLNRARPVRERTGQVTAWFGTSTDIEEKKRAEDKVNQMNADLERRVQERTAQLEASNRELEAFSYSVAHDLRSPLRSIDGFSQAFLEDYASQLPEDAKLLLQRSRQASQRMSHLIDDLLNLSRVSRAELRHQRVNLSEIADLVVTELTKNEPQRKTDFHIQPDIVVIGDDRLLRLAMENLLGNAFKFTGKTRQPRIEFGSVVRDSERILFVRDNGAGFDMTYAGKLFGPFQRLHAATDYPGTGIGLATVHRIIGRHGGKIWPEAAEGKGATFYFTLPS